MTLNKSIKTSIQTGILFRNVTHSKSIAKRPDMIKNAQIKVKKVKKVLYLIFTIVQSAGIQVQKLREMQAAECRRKFGR